METQEIKKQIEEILIKTLPKDSFIFIGESKRFFDEGKELKIAFGPSDYNINGVSGQKPQLVSLLLDLTDMELNTQVFGGNGGGRIYRKPNLDDPKEKYLAMKGVKIPFRKPKKELKFVLSAIERFAQNYVKTLKDNIDVLMYQDLIDYKKYLSV